MRRYSGCSSGCVRPRVPKVTIVPATDPSLEAFFDAGWEASREVQSGVSAVLADVRARGDAAIVEYERRWDSPAFQLSMLRVPVPTPNAASGLVSREVAGALALARERVADFHERQRRPAIEYHDEDGTRYSFLFRPLDAVAAYVPGGSAPLLSTVVMTVVPAKTAGVGRIVVCTPPQRDGRVPSAILYACSICGADELYAVGGAQAIGAVAFGTETIARIDKIVGPGNRWVTEAKRQVYGVCAIDGLAGPSEVLVVADETADARDVAGELLAQAEHDPQARVAALSQSPELLHAVAQAIAEYDLGIARRGEVIESVLRTRCRLIGAASFDELCATIERFAPEHLALRVADPEAILARVSHVGAVFVGSATPVACGDYVAGSNHVLPTSGSARFASGLRLDDFTRTFAVVENSGERIRHDAPAIAALAECEGLEQHAQSARARFDQH
jgi:histidinol dehydrogenase